MQDDTIQLLHVLSKLPVMTLSGQIGEVKGNIIFDPGEHYSLSLFKGFESWTFVVQKYNSRMLHDFGLVPSRNKVALWKGSLQKREGVQTTCFVFKVCVNFRLSGATLPTSSTKGDVIVKDFSGASGPI